MKGLESLCEIAPTAGNYNGDSNRLRQVVSYLIGNAIEVYRRGAVARKVDVAFRKTNLCLLRFTVSDTGIGIAKDNLGHRLQTHSRRPTAPPSGSMAVPAWGLTI